MPKPGHMSFILVSYVGAGAPALGHLMLLSQALEEKVKLQVEQPGFELAPIWDAGVVGGGFTRYTQVCAFISQI